MGKKRKVSSSSSRGASFLKVVDDAHFSNNLIIPRAFIKNFNGDVPQWFVLEIAGARKGWRVDTAQDTTTGGFYFGYGWNEFVEAQSLEFGDYLLFEYQQPLILQVKIFRKDGTEKTAGTNWEPGYETEGTGECRMLSPKTHAHGLRQPHLWSAHSCPSLVLADQCKEHEKWQEDSDVTEKITADQCGIHEQQQGVIKGIKIMSDARCRVQSGTGKVFATEQGVCYTVTWRNVPHLYYYLTLPRSIVKGKMVCNDETVLLKDQQGSTWPMKLRARPGGRVDLAKGWKKFLYEKDVRNGDILTFEFALDDVIHVHIKRAPQLHLPSETTHKMEAMASFEEKCTDKEVGVGYTAPNHNVPEAKEKTESVFFHDFTQSSFSVTGTHRTRGSYLHIPKSIATKQNLRKEDMVIVYDPEGTKWPMKIRTRPSDGRVGLAQGWSPFWRHHHISYGDTLVFKFVSDHLIKVDIIRAFQVHPSLLNVRPITKQEAMQLD